MSELYPTVKICASCKLEKPLSEFHKMSASPDGYRPSCKVCRKERDNQPKIILQRPLFIFSKVCARCQEEKPIEQFNRMSDTKDGYHVHCRHCQSEYNHQHRIDHLEDYRARARVKNGKPRTKAQQMKRHQERSAIDPQYLAQRKQWRQNYYQNHKEQAKDFYPRRRALILSATVGEVDYTRILERDGYFCYICQRDINPNAKAGSREALTFDHIIPLHPRPGEPQGTHSEDNLSPAHHCCNVRKGNRPFETLTPFDRRGP